MIRTRIQRVVYAIALLVLLVASDSALATETKMVCHASWYGPGFHGRTMANGQMFNMNDPTVVAHKSLKFGTKLVLRNPENGKTLQAVVKDRGPYIKGRCLDLSKAGAIALGYLGAGTTKLEVRVLR